MSCQKFLFSPAWPSPEKLGCQCLLLSARCRHVITAMHAISDISLAANSPDPVSANLADPDRATPKCPTFMVFVGLGFCLFLWGNHLSGPRIVAQEAGELRPKRDTSDSPSPRVLAGVRWNWPSDVQPLGEEEMGGNGGTFSNIGRPLLFAAQHESITNTVSCSLQGLIAMSGSCYICSWLDLF